MLGVLQERPRLGCDKHLLRPPSSHKLLLFRPKPAKRAFIIFWDKDFGDKSPDESAAPYHLDTEAFLQWCEEIYDYYVNTLKFAHYTALDKSYLDSYKFQIYLWHQTEWAAYGSGPAEDITGCLWVNPEAANSRSTVAHEIVATASAAAKDASYAWMGFFVNENYINAKYSYNLSELAADYENGFYPVANDGVTKLEKWTSYIPGMWFAEDGNAGGWAFWQYYTSNYEELGYHDFQAPGLLYVGKNPGNEYAVGASATSRAIAGGKAFNVTLQIAE